MSNALATQSIPGYLQKYVKADGEKNREQFGHLDPADFGLNFIKCVYDNSRTKSGTWGPNQSEQRPPSGTMYLSRNGHVIDAGTPFIPLRRSVRYIYWEGRPGDGRMVFATDNPNDPRIKSIDGLAWRKDPVTGKSLPPLVTTYVSFSVLLASYSEQPVILSFKRTGINEGRILSQQVLESTGFGGLDMFTLKFTLEQPRIVKDGSMQWYAFNIKPAGFTDEVLLEKAQKMAEFAKAMDSAASAFELEEDEPHSGPAITIPAGPTQSATSQPPSTAPAAAPAAPVITPPASVATEAQQAQPAAASEPKKQWGW